MWPEDKDEDDGESVGPGEEQEQCTWDEQVEQYEGKKKAKQKKPTASQAAKDWKAVLDCASGKHYYWNQATNQTAWERPEVSSDDMANLVDYYEEKVEAWMDGFWYCAEGVEKLGNGWMECTLTCTGARVQMPQTFTRKEKKIKATLL